MTARMTLMSAGIVVVCGSRSRGSAELLTWSVCVRLPDSTAVSREEQPEITTLKSNHAPTTTARSEPLKLGRNMRGVAAGTSYLRSI